MNPNDEKHKLYERLKVAGWLVSLVVSVTIASLWAHSMVGVS